MNISYHEIVPDIKTYYDLRASVDLINKDIPEGGRTSIQLIAAPGKEGFYIKQGFKVLPNEDSGPALRKVIYT